MGEGVETYCIVEGGCLDNLMPAYLILRRKAERSQRIKCRGVRRLETIKGKAEPVNVVLGFG